MKNHRLPMLPRTWIQTINGEKEAYLTIRRAINCPPTKIPVLTGPTQPVWLVRLWPKQLLG